MPDRTTPPVSRDTATPSPSDPDGSVDITAPTVTHSESGLSDGTYVFKVRAVDNAGNAGNVASFTVNVDTTVPVATLSAPGRPHGTFTLTITFNEVIDGATFVAGDLTITVENPPLSSAPISDFTTSDNQTWTATISPSPSNVRGDVTIVLEADKVKDRAGTNNIESNTVVVDYDND